jgi:hypothetical protein
MVAVAMALGCVGSAHGAASRGFSLEVVLDGGVRPEYRARGAVYVEAVRDRPYVLRITNPLPVRVAVALSVDGLNTIDARCSDARSASKWVLGPYESVEVPGWQVSGSDARRFFFTGERSSYGAWLGTTDDLGVIEAVFYREKDHPIRVVPVPVQPRAQGPARERETGSARGDKAPAPSSGGLDGAAGCLQKEGKLSDEYAATGIGERTRHDVERVALELEDRPASVVRIRYEFREQLLRLGVLSAAPDPLTRREAARGFAGGYCPEPPGGR